MPNEYVWKPPGRLIRRPVELTLPGEVEIEVSENTLAGFIPKRRVKLQAMVRTPIGTVSANLTDTDAVLAVQLSALKIITTFEVLKDGKVVPTWQREGTFATLLWNPPTPDRCRLIYCAMILQTSESEHTSDSRWVIAKGQTFLFAINPVTKGAFKLPLPNLYADCHICAGHGAYFAPTPVDCFLQTLEKFETSTWNADLLDSIPAQADKARQFFSFTAADSKDNVFPAVPMTLETNKTWEKFCTPASHSILENVILP